MPTNKIAPKKGVYNPPHASLQRGPGNEVGVQSLSKVVGTPMVSRYICLFTIIPSKNLIGGEGGGAEVLQYFSENLDVSQHF